MDDEAARPYPDLSRVTHPPGPSHPHALARDQSGLCVLKKNLITNRLATGEEPTWRSRAHKLDNASHTYFTSLPFPAPRPTVSCGWGGDKTC